MELARAYVAESRGWHDLRHRCSPGATRRHGGVCGHKRIGRDGKRQRRGRRFGLGVGSTFCGDLTRGCLVLREVGVSEERGVSVNLVLLLSSVTGTVVGVLGLLVAARERRRGSAWWVVPGIFGALVIVLCLLRLAWVAA